MSLCYCFSCGSEKRNPFQSCSNCGLKPCSENERVLSLSLSDYVLKKDLLTSFSELLINDQSLSIPSKYTNKAIEILNDPQLIALLSNEQDSDDKSKKKPLKNQKAIEPEKIKGKTLDKTYLHDNPFFILGISTRDDRRKIVEAAEERSFEYDHDACQKARSNLTNPRSRLSKEIEWFPGVSPKKTLQLIEQVVNEPFSLLSENGLPVLAHLNLLSAAFEAVDVNGSVEHISGFICELSELVDELDVDDVLRDINEDRHLSGFPEINDITLIENEFSERKRFYRNTINNSLNSLPSLKLVEVMTHATDIATDNGEAQAPELINELVDSYQVESQGFLELEAENIDKLLTAITSNASSGEAIIKPLIDKLIQVTRNWDMVAQPIQLSAKSRGIDHKASSEVAHTIRNLGIELFNEHDLLPQAQRITELLQELFSELPELIERVDEDSEALGQIFYKRKQADVQFDEWAKEITYSVEIGAVFKDKLSISPEGIMWKNKSYPLEKITRVRWGAVRHSVNGIPTGTDYTVAFGDDRFQSVVELKREKVYSAFLDKLWKAVCIRLMTDMLEQLGKGQELHFNDAIIRDDGVTLTKHKLFSSNEQINFDWSQVTIWSSGGEFVIAAQNDKKTYASMSYIDIQNVHIIEQIIRMKFKSARARRLSDLLNIN